MKISVVGNGLDALVCTSELLELGHDVKLFSTTKNLGGHFLGHKNSHGKFDTGMVLLENDNRSVPVSGLSNFNSEFGRSLRPFLIESFRWLKTYSGELQEELVITKLISGREVPDYFIADNLVFLDYLREEDKKDLISNLESYLFHSSKGSGYLPANKLVDKNFNTLTITDYYCNIFGKKFYETFFQNFLNNLAPQPFLQRAKDHRRFWLPLYFPESIYFQMTKDVTFKSYNLNTLRFDKPQNMMISDMVSDISKSINEHPNFHFILLESFANINRIIEKNGKVVVFLPTEQLKNILPNSRKIETLGREIMSSVKTLGSAKIDIVHYCIPKNESRTVFFQEDMNGLLRYSISQQKGNEKNSAASFEFKGTIDFELQNALEIIKNLGFEVLCEGSHIPAPFKPKVLQLADSEWKQFIGDYSNEFEKNSIYGPTIHPEATSFNDNLVRGLAYAAIISREG